MYQRSMLYLSLILLLCLGVLFLVNVKNIVQVSSATPDAYFHHNDIKGIAVEYKQRLYTLNFKQQNDVIDILNRAIPIEKIIHIDKKPDFSRLIVYTFDKRQEIEFTPLAFNNDDLIFYAPKLIPKGYLMEVSAGELHELLANAHDP